MQAPTLGATVFGRDIAESATHARMLDRAGVDAVWTGEFYFRSATVALTAMAAATERCRIGSSIMYGVGRSPLVLAAEARDLDEVSGGRLVLGLGNGTRRMMRGWHGVDPDSPASRMEELVPLLRSLWRLHEGPVRHAGRFYDVDIVPTGAPPPLRERIPIHVAGVNERMIEAAGRVADGLLGHPLLTASYLTDVARPALARGAERAGRDPGEIELATMVLTCVTDDAERARNEVAAHLAFYASVRSYERPLDRMGFGAEGAAIRAAFARRDFPAMAAAVSDEMLDAMALVGSADEVRARLGRYAGAADHLILQPPTVGSDPALLPERMAGIADVVPRVGRSFTLA